MIHILLRLQTWGMMYSCFFLEDLLKENDGRFFIFPFMCVNEASNLKKNRNYETSNMSEF